MKTCITSWLTVCIIALCNAQDNKTAKTPFDGYDLTWINGQSRIHISPLVEIDTLNGLALSGTLLVDGYFNYDFHQPVDHTHTSSGTIGRHNEFILNQLSLGLESSYKNTIGRIWLQTGGLLHLVQELGGSVNRGRNSGTGNLKFIREAAAGYHMNAGYGINLEMGIFMSYIGLESYVMQENWNYQRSMVCDFTPFYFQGVRLQYFPSRTLKQEVWIVNGWQSYHQFSKGPGFGSSTFWRPKENIQLAANFYLGHDTFDPDTLGNQSSRLRFYHDHSLVWRYLHQDQSKGISQGAVSLNNHYGFQQDGEAGKEITAADHFLYGMSLANRLWFAQDKLALTARFDFLHNGGAYLAFSPSLVTPNTYTEVFDTDPNDVLKLTQWTLTIDVMPADHFTLRWEYGYRTSNLPYFAGPGGTTAPSGWVNGPGTTIPWEPDLVRSESRISMAVNWRL